MDFSYFPGKFSINGNVNVTKDNHVWSTPHWSDEFKVEFDVIVDKDVVSSTYSRVNCYFSKKIFHFSFFDFSFFFR